jgi:hypothetical protein
VEPHVAVVEVHGQRLGVRWELRDGHPDADLEVVVDAIINGHVRTAGGERSHVWYDGGTLGRSVDERERIAGWEA